MRFNSYQCLYDWSFNTCDCLVEVTIWAGLTEQCSTLRWYHSRCMTLIFLNFRSIFCFYRYFWFQHSFMKSTFYDWWSISTERIIAFDLKSLSTKKIPRRMAFEIQFLAWDRNQTMAVLNWLMKFSPISSRKWQYKWKQKITNTAQICFHPKRPHSITKMTDNINMNNTITGWMNVRI